MFIISNFTQKVHQCKFENLSINSPNHKKIHQKFDNNNRLLFKKNRNFRGKSLDYSVD